MPQMIIEILSKNVETKPTSNGKGTYSVVDIAFKNKTFGDKVEGKKILSFGETSQAFAVLSQASPKENYEITTNKNDRGYIDWTQASKIDPNSLETSVPKPSQNPSRPGVQASPVPTKSTYETPEERAMKQIYIVRQSSLSTAVDILKAQNAQITNKLVINLANELVDFVFNGVKDKKTKTEKEVEVVVDTATMHDDIPL